jgi:glycosyltransferase involved in cell wall biosynthesis
MAVTVGIPTTGERGQVLRETVEGVLRSAALVSADAEVLVVVNGRGRVPELYGIGSPLLRVRYLDRRNVAEARNAVLAEARHDTILFTDEDCAVPPEWCGQLAAGLRDPGYPVVAAPIRVAVAGPVSAYLDYHRAFSAVPDWLGGSLLIGGSNCGLRRDRLPASVRFNPRLHSAGEDTAFSIALTKAGLRVRWLADATPLVHGCSEEIEEISERFLRNARSGVHLFLREGYPDAAMPGVLNRYRQQIRDDYLLDRAFDELCAAEARSAFAVYDLILATVTAIGYLDELGTELGHPLLALDLPALSRAWRQMAGRVRARTARLSSVDWAGLEVDYRSMADRRRQPEPLLAEVRRALRRYARPIPTDPDGPVGDVLNHGLTEMTAHYHDRLAGIRQAFEDVVAGTGPATPDALDRAVRAHGVPLKAAVDAIELMQRRSARRAGEAARVGSRG